MSETVRCLRHGVDVPNVTKSEADARSIPFGCLACTAEVVEGPDPAGMDANERAVEVERWLKEPMMVAFDLIHRRIEQLVGRPVWTHEMASDFIIDEARTWEHPADLEAHVIGSLDQAAGPKPVIVVDARRVPGRDEGV